ncbi:helix-turn-helix domain-containing protein [Lysinibacillus fusiformis]|uniref:helix-turn-helix domain-containing protein n=1 Tax=Lysinibacillus fusiformis TaxID=28031 RepID=UPI0020BF66B9|nr:helix-turn-helix domain-containing protein [Lysinibacillus fusiformis]
MDYMSAKEAAFKWGISKRRVQTLCAEDRIKGVSKVGMVWVIPKNAEKPEDERLKINKD